ncbi:hypothetical protein AB0D54_06865 [Streptomyces xanthophaeus]|uniref:hypothetical protein n=1 Tax=Streptomyces xanthophaeus TaxID=67385 RepID=UPI00342D2D39
MNTTTMGRLLAGLGAVVAVTVWLPRAAFSIDGGFEGHARDLSVVYVDLPLIVLGGVLIPLSVWTLTTRAASRPWIAVLAALAALALGVWGLTEWWNPRQHPDPGYDIPGM